MEFDDSWHALLRPARAESYFQMADRRPFTPGAQGFSRTNAWWLCELSRLIYRQGDEEQGYRPSVPDRNHYLRRVGLREIRRFSSGTNYAALVIPEKEDADPFAVLVFRGTFGFEGWFSNLNAVQVPWPGGGAVHCGFRNDFAGLWRTLGGALDRMDAPVFYTGHSLGGALAILAAAQRPPEAVYTFGAPRVGDAVFLQTLRHTRIHRIENGRDIVPTVPPSVIPFDFCHPGTAYPLPPRHPRAPANPPGRSAGRLAIANPPEFLSDHAPVNYTAALERWIREA